MGEEAYLKAYLRPRSRSILLLNKRHSQKVVLICCAMPLQKGKHASLQVASLKLTCDGLEQGGRRFYIPMSGSGIDNIDKLITRPVLCVRHKALCYPCDDLQAVHIP